MAPFLCSCQWSRSTSASFSCRWPGFSSKASASTRREASGRRPARRLTLANYAELLTPCLRRFFFETMRISLLASLTGLLFAFPLAYWITRRLSPRWRAIAVGFFVTLMFLSVLVRTYALELTFGAAGPLRPLPAGARHLSEQPGLHRDPRRRRPAALYRPDGDADAARHDPERRSPAGRRRRRRWARRPGRRISPSRCRLCMRGLLAAFLFAFTFSISAFVIPMILGKGRVLFISNLIYNRFSEIADYPSGAAISIVLFARGAGDRLCDVAPRRPGDGHS